MPDLARHAVQPVCWEGDGTYSQALHDPSWPDRILLMKGWDVISPQDEQAAGVTS